MPLIRDGRVVTDDPWTLVPDDQEIPPTGDVVVGLARWQAEKEALRARTGRVGVRVDPGDDVSVLAPDLAELPLVAVSFPVFSDGRGYSSARLLRERDGYRGELRAVGDVLADQLAYMRRCGIDAFALKDGKRVDAALRSLQGISVTYQGAVDDPRPLYRRGVR